MLNFRTLDGYGGRPAPSDKVKNELAEKLMVAYKNAYKQNYFIGADINVMQGADADKLYKFTFEGETYTALLQDIKAVDDLRASTWRKGGETIELPSLEYVNSISMHNGAKLSLPLIKRVQERTVL